MQPIDQCSLSCCSEVASGGSLSLTSVTRFHAGVYSCHADNGVPPAASRRVRLDVVCMYMFCVDYFRELMTGRFEKRYGHCAGQVVGLIYVRQLVGV